MPDGAYPPALRIPAVFFGLEHVSEAARGLRDLIARIGDAADPNGLLYIADNLIAYGHTAGFRRDPAFAAAVLAARPKPMELALAWRTHALCWAAKSCLSLPGDYVECGTYEGYSMEVVLRFLDGLPGRRLWMYDVFDPSGGPGEGKRLAEHSPELFDRVRVHFAPWANAVVTRGKVPEALDHGAPERIAFLHIDMNNAAAERGAVEWLWDRLAVGGMVVFDDYGWTGYQDQKAAADGFAAERGLSVLELPTGQGLLVKR